MCRMRDYALGAPDAHERRESAQLGAEGAWMHEISKGRGAGCTRGGHGGGACDSDVSARDGHARQ